MIKQTIHLGPMPLPLGGISIYLYRLSKINTDKDTSFINEILLNKRGFIKLLFLTRNKLFIYHSPSLYRRILLYVMSLFTSNEYILVSHGQGIENSYKNANKLVKYFIKLMILKSKKIQIVGSHLEKFLLNIGYNSEQIIIQNAFIPPPLEDENKILATYEDTLNDFIKNQSKIIIANASSLVFHNDVDLYGLDMCIELTAKLKNDYPNIGFVFALANEKANVEYLEKMKTRIQELEIEDNFYFITGQKELWPLFKQADLMIRPTSSDG